MNITVKLFRKFDTQQVSEKFKKREFIGLDDSNSEYPQYIKFELILDKCDELDKYELNESINIEFNLNGRLYVHPEKGDMFFNTLQAWRISTDAKPHDHTKASQDAEDDLSWMENN